MAFFEGIGKKLSDAGQSVAQQTKNFADVAQLNSAINEAEKKIAQFKNELGQLYYEAHKTDANVEGANIIAQINALYDEIQTTKEKINSIKGIVKCEKCGASLPQNSKFCLQCGEKIAESSLVTCPGCGKQVQKGKFCLECGYKFAITCSKCGTEVENGKFCPQCGEKL